MKVSYKYGDRASLHDFGEDIRGCREHSMRYGNRPPADGEFRIDLDETDPKKITKYIKFAAKNEELYDILYGAETHIQIDLYKCGAPGAKKEFKKLAKMHVLMTYSDMGPKDADLDRYFSDVLKIFEQFYG